MKALNEALVQRKIEGRYVTLLLMLWHPHTRSFTMANAGGSPPMVCRNREILKIQVEGVPLGLLPDREYEERNFQASPGDLVVLFSDGVSDHVNLAGEEYGRWRMFCRSAAGVRRRILCGRFLRIWTGLIRTVRRSDFDCDAGEIVWGRFPPCLGGSVENARAKRSVPEPPVSPCFFEVPGPKARPGRSETCPTSIRLG
jgi:hypothetical protein